MVYYTNLSLSPSLPPSLPPGYEQFGLMRSDPALCFKALCGEEPAGTKKKKKHLAKKAIAAAKAMATTKSDSEESESGEESEGDEDSGPSAPATPNPKR